MSNVPKLRFKEFNGEWEEKKLGNLTTLMQSGLSRLLSDSDIGLPVIRSNNMVNGKLDVTDIKYWYKNDTQGAKTENYFLKENDLLVNFINSLAQIGKVVKYENLLNRDVIFTTNIMRLRFKEDINSSFIFNFCHTKKYENYIQTITKPAVNQASFTTKDFNKLFIYLPSKQEQEKIASFLISADTKIEQLTKQEQLLQQYKKGVMQKIFNQEIRFKADDGSEFCDWEETKLNNFLIERVDYPKNVLPIYSLTIENGIIPKSERYERAFLVKDDYEYKTMKKDDFAFNPMNLRFGALARHKKDLDVMVSKYYNIFYCNEKLNAYFAELYFTNYDSIQYYNKMATGSLEEKKRVHFKEFLKFRFEFPCLEEQNKIANFLYSIDTKIQQTQKQLNSTKEFKKALLQQMFV